MSNKILDHSFNDLYSIRDMAITPNEVAYMAEKKGIKLTESDLIDTMDNIREKYINSIERDIENLVVISREIEQDKMYAYIDNERELLHNHSVKVINKENDGYYNIVFLTGHATGRKIKCKSNNLKPIRN